MENVQDVCEEAWILDDASSSPPPLDVFQILPKVRMFKARRWSGDNGALGEGIQRDHLLQQIKRRSGCAWVLQLDADERLSEPTAIRDLTDAPDLDGWLIPLIDYYITPEDEHRVDLRHPESVRSWFGVETRWTLALFRNARGIYVSRGDVREPQGFRPDRIAKSRSAVVLEHFGKAVSVAEWERKVDYYVSRYPHYREKWLARRGAAVHDYVSDFGTRLLKRGDPNYVAAEMPSIYEYAPDRGVRVALKRVLFGMLAPSLLSAKTEVVSSQCPSTIP